MERIKVQKGTTLDIMIANMDNVFGCDINYELSQNDSFLFVVERVTNNKDSVIEKSLGSGLEIIHKDIIVHLFPSDTKNLDEIAYRYYLKMAINSEQTQQFIVTTGVFIVEGGD